MKILKLFFLLIITAACNNIQPPSEVKNDEPTAQPTNKVLLAEEVEWSPLNPARGDQSPQAGTLWGDRNAEVATGFLVKFKDGFSSPPHIHNVSYKGIVISGLVHNDDPKAAKMWMPAGAFWTQPAGEAHITAAKGTENIALIEIPKGPYLVHATEQAFDNGERPINVDPSNIVWIDLPLNTKASDKAQIAYLWGVPQGNALYGTLLKLPAGFSGKINSQGATFRSVVIQGKPEYRMLGDTETMILNPGSYFSSEGSSIHTISSGANGESLLYVRTDGAFEVFDK